MAQTQLTEQVDAAVSRQALQQAGAQGEAVLKLIESAAFAFADPTLGRNVDVKA